MTICQTFFSFLSWWSSSSELELSDSPSAVIFFLFLFLRCCLRSLRFACRFCFFSSACSFSRCCCHNRSILCQLINCSLVAHNNITSTMFCVLQHPKYEVGQREGKGKEGKGKEEKVQEKTLMEINFWLWPWLLTILQWIWQTHLSLTWLLQHRMLPCHLPQLSLWMLTYPWRPKCHHKGVLRQWIQQY